MSRTVTIDGNDRTSSVRLDSLATVESAYGGEVGIGGCDRDDEALGDVPALKAVTITEGAASPTRMFTGATGPRGIDRGRLGSVDNRRSWDVSLLDMNTYLDDEVLVLNAANRPSETDYARVTWLLSAMSITPGVTTAGVVPNTNTVTMDAQDYRGATARQVLGDCAEAAGKNFFLYNYGSGDLLYYDKHTGTGLSSSSRLTTVAGDVDNSVTWAIEDPKVVNDPTRIYSTVVFKYGPADQNLTVTVTNGTTEATYRFRMIYVTDETVTTAAAATVVANQYLDAASSEETTLTCSATLPAANVNDIRAGQRVQIKATHLNISTYTYYRCTRRKVMGAPGRSGVSDVVYRLELEFAPDVKMTHFGSGKGGNPPPPDCTDCTKRVAILPSGMDDDLSLAEGRSHMFVYDALTLASYDCSLANVGTATTSVADLTIIDHEPVYEALFAGDRAFYTGTVGAFGDDRWSNGSNVSAGRVMDIRRAWAVAQSDAPWVVDTHSAPAGYTIETDGTRLHYVTDTTAVADINISHATPGDWTSTFTMLADFVINQSTVTQVIAWAVGDAFGSGNCISFVIAPNGTAYTVYVEGPSGGTFNAANPGTTFNSSGTTWRVKWEHTYGGTSRAKVWDTGGAEPGGWLVSRDASGDVAAAGDDFLMNFDTLNGDATEAWMENLKFGASTYDNFNRTTTSPDIGTPSSLGAGYALETRDMTDGALVASVGLSYGVVYDVRATPNGQHLMVLNGNDDNGPFERYSRTLTLEDSYSLTNIFVDLADFNVDDSYNVYKMTTAGVLTRYGASSSTAVWSVDLQSLYTYRWPSRLSFGAAFGTGQTIIADGSNVKVCGYLGGADWEAGSTGVVLTLSRADGSLVSMTTQEPAGGAVAAQTMAMAMMGQCLWLAGAVDADTFEGLAPGGLSGWIMKLPPEEGGTFDAVSSSVSIGDE